LKELLVFERKTFSEDNLKLIAQTLKKSISKNAILLLSGEVGAGKTTFTRFFCAEYSLNQVQSPTYSIHQKYENQEILIHHFDLYRLNTEDDLVSTGFWDFLQQPTGIKLIEWSENIHDPDWFRSYLTQQEVFRLKIILSADSEIRIYQLFKIT
jgi:tRNA threonylcarbamoyladenosine biosynthesis protein TsaE